MEEDFEIGVYDADLYYSGKLKEWLELRTKQYEMYPNDRGTRYRFAEALIENNKFEEALSNLKKFHDDYPTDLDFNQQIIEAVLKLGRTKKDFNWKIEPKSFKLDDQLQAEILSIMKTKRKRKMKLGEIYISLAREVMEFDETELTNYLKKSDNFKVAGDIWFDAVVERKG